MLDKTQWSNLEQRHVGQVEEPVAAPAYIGQVLDNSNGFYDMMFDSGGWDQGSNYGDIIFYGVTTKIPIGDIIVGSRFAYANISMEANTLTFGYINPGTKQEVTLSFQMQYLLLSNDALCINFVRVGADQDEALNAQVLGDDYDPESDDELMDSDDYDSDYYDDYDEEDFIDA